MKFLRRSVLWVLLIVTVLFFLLSVASLFVQWLPSAKLFSTTSVLAGVSALFQLDVSGFFETLFEKYSDSEKYPYGPPSFITRELTDVPDNQLWQEFRHRVLFETRTGFWLGVFSLLLSIPGTWL